MSPKQAVPDAIAPVVAAVMQEHPAASPTLLARLVVAELRDLGWHITPGPTRRSPGAARGARIAPGLTRTLPTPTGHPGWWGARFGGCPHT